MCIIKVTKKVQISPEGGERMLIERLKEKFNYDEPIFISEIYSVMKDYSRSKIFELINEAIHENTLNRYDYGIYYLPRQTIIGDSILSLDDVIEKKYIYNNDKTFGIFGLRVMEVNFSLSTQIPALIEVITNNESRKSRLISIRGRNILLKKSRTTITNENYKAYMILEFFTRINVNEYLNNDKCQKEIKKYISENKISKIQVTELLNSFPAKTTKNLIVSEVFYEFT